MNNIRMLILATLLVAVAPLASASSLLSTDCTSDDVSWVQPGENAWQVPDFPVAEMLPLCDGKLLAISNDKRLALLDLASKQVLQTWTLSFKPTVLSHDKAARTVYAAGFADDFGPLTVASLIEDEAGFRIQERTIRAAGSLSHLYAIHAAGDGILFATGVEDNDSILDVDDAVPENTARDVIAIVDVSAGVVVNSHDFIGTEHSAYDPVAKALITTSQKQMPGIVMQHRYDASNRRLYAGMSRGVGQTALGVTVSPTGDYLAVQTMYLTETPSGYAFPLQNPRAFGQYLAQIAGIGTPPVYVVFSPNRQQIFHPATDGDSWFALQSYDLPAYTPSTLVSAPRPDFSCPQTYQTLWPKKPRISSGGRLAIWGTRCGSGSYDITDQNLLVWAAVPVAGDQDNDGVLDAVDQYPSDASQHRDSDTDGSGDAIDSDDDNDSVNDESDNCPLLANADQANQDGDAFGNACDDDDDNDLLPDSYEQTHGLDPLNASDASSDSDGDGRSNLTEYHSNTNPTQNDDDGQSLLSDGFYPLQVGATWTYNNGSAKVKSQNGAIVRIEPNTGNWYELELGSNGIRQTQQYLSAITGPDGKSHTVKLTFGTPMIVLPKQIEVGQVFEQQGTVSAAISGYGTNTLTFKSRLVVEGIETRNTPNGSKRTLRLHRTYLVQGSVGGASVLLKSAQRTWYAKDVGPVRIADTETAFIGNPPQAAELTAYTTGGSSGGGSSGGGGGGGGGGSMPIALTLLPAALLLCRLGGRRRR